MIWLVLILVAITFWLMTTYNFFVATLARIKASVQEIGNQLKRQADLIPNLESSVKGYLKHEKGIFEDLTSARKQIANAVESGDVQKMADAGSKLHEVYTALGIGQELDRYYADNPSFVHRDLHGRNIVVDDAGKIKFLDYPMDNNRLLLGQPIFGSHKTWRGFFAAIAFSTISFAIQKYIGISSIIDYSTHNLLFL